MPFVRAAVTAQASATGKRQSLMWLRMAMRSSIGVLTHFSRLAASLASSRSSSGWVLADACSATVAVFMVGLLGWMLFASRLIRQGDLTPNLDKCPDLCFC